MVRLSSGPPAGMELVPHTGSERLQCLLCVQVQLFGADTGDPRQWKFWSSSLLIPWCRTSGYWNSGAESALNFNKSSQQRNIMSFTIRRERFEISPFACLVLLSFVRLRRRPFSQPPHLCFVFLPSLSSLELGKKDNEEDNSLADNSLAVS